MINVPKEKVQEAKLAISQRISELEVCRKELLDLLGYSLSDELKQDLQSILEIKENNLDKYSNMLKDID